ncbi:MAG: LptF/LptG family permease, partial [Rickettsiales bacterium]|nr:LptF/LptG family permease [Rickettsiales bacterium]
MKVYQRYLYRNLVKYFFLSLSIVAGTMWAVRSMGYLDYMTRCGLSILEFVSIMIFSLPRVLLMVIPFGIFISIILYYDKIARNNELIILRVSGLEKRQLAYPSLLLGLVGCLLSSTMTFYFVPKSNLMFRSTLGLVESNITNLLLTSENFNKFQNITLYLGDRDGNNMGFLMAHSGGPGYSKNKILYAKSATLLDNNHLELRNGNIQEFQPGVPDEIKVLFFDQLTLNLKDIYSVQGRFERQSVDYMYPSELFKIEKKSLSVKGEI